MVWRGIAFGLAFALAALTSAGLAQEAATQSPVLTIEPERLFAESRFGTSALARFEREQAEFLAENKKLEVALEAEEKSLTDRRPSLPIEDFRKLADAFDAKAEEIRAARLAKSRSLTTTRDEDQKRFLAAIGPILGEMMGEMGALVILDKKTVFLSFERLDVTDLAIARIDSVLGDSLQTIPQPQPTEGPDPAP